MRLARTLESFGRPCQRRHLAWAGALFIAAVVTLAAVDVARGYYATLADTNRELESQARTFAEHTSRGLQAVDVVLRHIAAEHARGRLARLSTDELHDYLAEQAVGLVQIRGLVMFDARGDALAISWLPTGTAINIAHLEGFRRARADHRATLVVGGATRSPTDGHWMIPIGRRLEHRDGSFAGVVGARVRIEYFTDFYRDIHLDEGTHVTLRHHDGSVLARHGLDVVDRFEVVRTLPDYPIDVVVGRDAEVALAAWRKQAAGTALRTIALAALAAALLALLALQLKRLDRARSSLEVTRERFALAVAGSADGIWDWDLRRDLLFLSARCQELLWPVAGEPLRPRREWIAMTEYHPDDVTLVRAAVAAHLNGHTRHMKVEYRLRHHGGDWRWYRQRGVAVRDAHGQAYRMAGSMEDITERKRAEAERERLEQQLRQSQRLEAMGTLAGGIAHDFNNILAAIIGYGEMVQRRVDAAGDVRRHIDAAMSAAMRAKSLVERILAFSRSGLGERAPVHVQSVVAEALDALLASLPPRITLRRELAAGNAAVLGDATQIHQVVMNLCANGVQAIGEAGTLEVGVGTAVLDHARDVTTGRIGAGRYVRLSVRDSGAGIAPGVLERIFDPFFTTKQIGVGTGLGLSLVHGIVTDLGGGIEVASELGVGSLMTVWLPCSGEAAAPQREAPAVVAGNGETVLLVDDEVSLVRLGEEMMAELGYEPVGFTSSGAALRSLREAPQRFDIVVTDEAMPEMTGSELVREIRKLRPDIPIVMMSGYVTPSLAARARDAGVSEVLAKPLAAHEIARSLAAALR